MVRPGKKATHKCSRVEGSLTSPLKFQGPVSEPNCSSCNGQLNNSSLHKQTGRNSLSGYVRTPVEDHDMVPSLSHNVESQTPSRCLNVMADLLSRLNQVQSTEWSLHPQVFKQICRRWFTPNIDLFATHLNHKLPLYVSPIPDPNAWDIDALNINLTCLTAYAYPLTALHHSVIQKIRQYHCLIIIIAPGWPGMPWFWDLVQLSREIRLQLPVSTTLLKQSHNYVFHSNPQHLNLHAWCLGVDSSKNKTVEVAERIAAPQRSSTRTIYKSKWAPFEKWCTENSVDFSTPSVKHISDFFMYLYQDLNRHPSTMVTGRLLLTLLAQWGHHIA